MFFFNFFKAYVFHGVKEHAEEANVRNGHVVTQQELLASQVLVEGINEAERPGLALRDGSLQILMT
jgi:hypothetical protein